MERLSLLGAPRSEQVKPARSPKTICASTVFNNSKNLTSSSQELRLDIAETTRRRESDMKRESLNTSISLPQFQSGDGVYDHTGGTYSHSGMMDYPRIPITDVHLGNVPDSMEFQSWKVNCKTEVCSKTADPHLIMHWIKEVETAKSIDELMTSRSIETTSPTTRYA